ncbi:MAG: SCP2 sterol-binding domain-containing protein [Natronospirillum sp.]
MTYQWQHISTKAKGVNKHLLLRGIPLLPTRLIVHTLNIVVQKILRPYVAQGDLDCLINHVLKVEISDINMHINVTLKQRQIVLSDGSAQPGDVAFTGDLHSFLQLALQLQDPDSLFFRRKLMISGDTALGLTIRNCLDRLEAKTVMPAPLYQSLSAAERLLADE